MYRGIKFAALLFKIDPLQRNEKLQNAFALIMCPTSLNVKP